MEINISRLCFEEMGDFIERGDFSIESDYILKVKKYREEDAVKFYIEKTTFPVQITSKEFKKEFKIKSYKDIIKEAIQRDRISFKAVVNNTIVGIIVAEYESWEKDLFIYELAVDKQFRGKGIATKLIKTLESMGYSKDVPYIMLQVDYRNYPAVSFYEKTGFEIIGVMHRSIDTIFMRKSLKRNMDKLNIR